MEKVGLNLGVCTGRGGKLGFGFPFDVAVGVREVGVDAGEDWSECDLRGGKIGAGFLIGSNGTAAVFDLGGGFIRG